MAFNAELPTFSGHNMAAEGSSSMKKPNRRQFQSILEDLNRNINETDAAITALRGKRNNFSRETSSSFDQQGELFRLKNQIVEIKRERENIRSSLNRLNTQIEELDKKIKQIKDEMSKIEYEDLCYKDEQVLQKKIANLKDQYSNLKSGSLRVELGIVKEIDRLERNAKRLDKWKKLIVEKDEMVKKFNELKADRHKFYKRNQYLKNNLNDTFHQQADCRTRARVLSKELDQLTEYRKTLIVNYDKERQIYIEWNKQNNQIPHQQLRQGEIINNSADHRTSKVKRTPSWKPNKYSEDSSDSETEDYEPYAKEKQICRNLISYLQNFLPEPQKLSDTAADTSADDKKLDAHSSVTTGFKKDEIDEEVHTYSSLSPKQVLKRHSKREKRKPTQPIPLEPHVMVDFVKVDVTAPVNYSEVPIAFEKVKERLQFYEEQMYPNLSFSYSYDENGYPSSESEMTVDSARFSVTWSEADDSLSSPAMQSLSQSSTFEKQCSIKDQSSSFEIESPKLTSSPLKVFLYKRDNRLNSCGGRILTKDDDDNSFLPSVKLGENLLKMKCSSLNSLSIGKVSKGSTYDEGIDVFLSKDSSANSNNRI